MAWRVARSLDVLLGQLNARAPRRSKGSDGSIGDLSHSSRDSDHNPDPAGIVRARDFTHDPAGGLDCHWLASQLVAARDPRAKYIIWNGRIWQAGRWTTYTGDNPHTKHLHLSVVAGSAADSTASWDLGPEPGGFLMSLSSQEQRDLYNRIFGMLRQRHYTIVDNGAAVEVDANHPGAKPATVLDTLDGNHLVRRIDALEAKLTAPVPVEVDYDRIINGLFARLAGLQFIANTEEA
jgi:hypothetical protein